MATDQLAQEEVAPGEAACFADMGNNLKTMITQNYPTGTMRRDAHPKMHGLVKAEFIVEPNLAPELQIGIFKQGGKWPCWVRFSNQNATMQADIKGDIRGMAIKLMGVPGKKILDYETESPTQDFIVISTKVFVTRTPQEFHAMVQALLKSKFALAWYFLTHLNTTINLLKSNKKFANPLQIQYFSTTPYLFGKTAAKYSARPQVANPDPIPENPSADYLREAMLKQLANGDAVFDFMVQLQTDAKTMPIEDPSVEWHEAVSPFRKVATIRIPQQEFDTPKRREYGENLSFTPWHCLPEHRPLGGVNRARRVVYDFISRFRHEKNGVKRSEPSRYEI